MRHQFACHKEWGALTLQTTDRIATANTRTLRTGSHVRVKQKRFGGRLSVVGTPGVRASFPPKFGPSNIYPPACHVSRPLHINSELCSEQCRNMFEKFLPPTFRICRLLYILIRKRITVNPSPISLMRSLGVAAPEEKNSGMAASNLRKGVLRHE